MKEITSLYNLTPLQRMRHMKVWLFLVVVAIAFGVYGISTIWSRLDPIVKEIYLVNADLEGAQYRLKKIEQQIIREREKGDVSEKLIEKKESIIEEIKELDAKLKRLYKECERRGIDVGQFKHLDQSYLIDWFLTPAYASNADQGQDSTTSKKQVMVDKELVLKIVFIILVVVYLLALYKVFFSRNPKNMNVAIDLVKSITGFWIGIGTTVLSIV
ncbi:MAG: hypothetical protein ACFFCF_12605 [Promethearchaeota archaeon]